MKIGRCLTRQIYVLSQKCFIAVNKDSERNNKQEKSSYAQATKGNEKTES